LVLASGAPAVGPAARREQQQQYADEVLQRFRVKLCGDRAGGDQEAVRQQVGRLIAAATSPARLARMYEGWMPWV
jgi:phosphatidylinositol kinase/protein kinase (PI-3  family)